MHEKHWSLRYFFKELVPTCTSYAGTRYEWRRTDRPTQNKIGVSNQRNIGCDYHYFNYQTKWLFCLYYCIPSNCSLTMSVKTTDPKDGLDQLRPANLFVFIYFPHPPLPFSFDGDLIFIVLYFMVSFFDDLAGPVGTFISLWIAFRMVSSEWTIIPFYDTSWKRAWNGQQRCEPYEEGSIYSSGHIFTKSITRIYRYVRGIHSIIGIQT